MSAPISSFSEFSAQLMQQASIHKLLDQLEQHRLNPNCLQFLIWTALDKQGRLLLKDIRNMLQVSMDWHSRIVRSLDHLANDVANSRRLKTIQSLIQQEIIAAQQVEQRLLVDTQLRPKKLRRTEVQQLRDACSNIMNYCKLGKIVLDRQLQQHINQLLEAAFPGLSRDDIHDCAQQSLYSKLSYSTPTQMDLYI